MVTGLPPHLTQIAYTSHPIIKLSNHYLSYQKGPVLELRLNSALLYCSQCSGKKLVFWKIIRITLTLFLLIVALSHVYCSSLIWRHLPMTRRHVERHNAMLLWPALRGCAVAECCVCHAVSRHVSRHIHHVTRHAAFILILHTLGHRSVATVARRASNEGPHEDS